MNLYAQPDTRTYCCCAVFFFSLLHGLFGVAVVVVVVVAVDVIDGDLCVPDTWYTVRVTASPLHFPVFALAVFACAFVLSFFFLFPALRVYVDPSGFDELPEGVARPGFFRGVATVVTKLLNVVQPDRAYFGQKDALQCVLVKRLAEVGRREPILQ